MDFKGKQDDFEGPYLLKTTSADNSALSADGAVDQDCYGPVPDYHACASRLDGRCRQSARPKEWCEERRVFYCEQCEVLLGMRLPGEGAACGACGSAWTVDPVTGLAYCAHCEATAGKRARKVIERRAAREKADRAFEAHQLSLLATVRR